MDCNRIIHIRHIIFILILLLKLSDIGAEVRSNQLDFSREDLKSVPAVTLEDIDVTNVTKVLYSHNSISVLKYNDFLFFCQFPNVRYLFFDHNVIFEIETDSFQCLPELTYLELSSNKLSQISNKLYDELISLRHMRYINLRGNPIESFSNIDRLLKVGIVIDYDDATNHHTQDNFLHTRYVKNRKKRSITAKRKASDAQLFSEDNTKPEFIKDSPELEKDQRFSTVEEDWSVDAEKNRVEQSYDNRTDAGIAHEASNNTVSEKYISSIIFNFFAASVVLVVIPVSMCVYYCVSKCERCS